jgi:predicted Zn-dependent protease
MKRIVVLFAVIALAASALWWAQTHKIEAKVGPETLMTAVATGQRELTRIPMSATRLSDVEEIRIGDSIASSYSEYFVNRNPTGHVEQTKMEDYIAVVGRNVSARARRKLPYKFHYIPDANFINAFALPGGHVFMGKGLMLLMDSEDELAAVLGHEVEHVDHYHCAERVQIEARLRHIPLSGLIELPFSLFQAGYTKDQELEADSDGERLAVWAGYSPQGAVHMFEAFAKLERGDTHPAKNPQQEVSRIAMQSLTEYFRSHPRAEDRIRNIQDLISRENWPPKPERDLQLMPSATVMKKEEG